MSNKKIVILGAGESGVGADLLAQHLGFEVFVSDFGRSYFKYQKKKNVIKILTRTPPFQNVSIALPFSKIRIS
jgi:hypothetical protein